MDAKNAHALISSFRGKPKRERPVRGKSPISRSWLGLEHVDRQDLARHYGDDGAPPTDAGSCFLSGLPGVFANRRENPPANRSCDQISRSAMLL
jgi:hypothetical protein